MYRTNGTSRTLLWCSCSLLTPAPPCYLLVPEIKLHPEHVERGNSLEGPRDDPLFHVEAGGKEPDKRLDPGTKVNPIWSHKGPESGRSPVREHHEAMSLKLHEMKERRHQVTRRGEAVIGDVSG